MPKAKNLPLNVLKGLGVTGFVIWSLVPVALIVVNSIRPERNIFSFRFDEFTLRNYSDLFLYYPDYLSNLGNSLIVALGATLLAVVSSALSGFAYSRYRSTALAASAIFAIAVRLLPPIVISLPIFPAANLLGLNDSYTLLILLYSTFWVSMLSIMMKTFIDQIPRSLDEATRVDGGNTWIILSRVILPLSIAGMVSGAIFVFVFSWNEYLFAFLFTTTRASTAPLVLSGIRDSVSGTSWGMLFAAATVQLVPIVVFVMLVQRFLVAGLTAGAVKG
jgi:multiple sugar transport system permease protein